MLMWDEPYNTLSHKIFIAFDSDRTHNFNGFKLDWSTDLLTYDLNNVRIRLTPTLSDWTRDSKRLESRFCGKIVILKESSNLFLSKKFNPAKASAQFSANSNGFDHKTKNFQ